MACIAARVYRPPSPTLPPVFRTIGLPVRSDELSSSQIGLPGSVLAPQKAVVYILGLSELSGLIRAIVSVSMGYGN